MERIIHIDEKAVPFKATASTIRRYRSMFGRDLLLDFQKLQGNIAQQTENEAAQLTVESLTIFENLAYIMAKQADPSIPGTPDEWLDGFDMFSIYEVLPQIVELWRVSELPTATSKKKTTD